MKITTLILAIIFGFHPVWAEKVGLFYNLSDNQHKLAAQSIIDVLEAKGHEVEIMSLSALSDNYPHKKIVLTDRTSKAVQSTIVGEGGTTVGSMGSEAYCLQTTSKNGKSYYILGGSGNGMLYGAMDLANRLMADNLEKSYNKTQSPFMNTRGIKFNIPLDARSPSYSDDGTAAWENVIHMWEMDFWTEFIDELARNYYNTITLWSLNPFPSMVKTPGFPNAALNDVYKPDLVWEAGQSAIKMYTSAVANNLIKVKTMTIDQKIQHWKAVMAYAKERGIKFYIMTWNIYPVSVVDAGYNITADINNPNTKAYYKNSVKAAFDTYPDLAGMGVTVGEKLGFPRATAEQAGKWVFDTYGGAIAEVKAENPNRKIKFIHREHYTRGPQINAQWQNWPGYNTPGDFDFSFKYQVAHMHASTKPSYINSFINERLPANKKTWLTIRNDDHYYMRWGDPDYIREFVNNFPSSQYLEGVYVGPDGYTWGREYVAKKPQSPKRQLVIKKFWYAMEIFGRLCYDPTTPNSYFQSAIANKFPGVSDKALFDAWQSTSKVSPLLTRFHWGGPDHSWYPELCMSDKGFKSVRAFLDPKFDPMAWWEDGQKPNIMTIQEFVNGLDNGELTPIDVANSLDQFSQTGLNKLGNMSGGNNQELTETITDIKMMANLGKYYADKIRGTVALHRFEEQGGQANKDEAIQALQNASAHWADYATLWASIYKGQVLTRQGTAFQDAQLLQSKVDEDITIARNAKFGGDNGGNITISFESPKNPNYPVGTNLKVTVKATTTVGNIEKVNLYVNDASARQEGYPPYSWDGADPKDAALLGNMANGSYQLRAVATDNSGNTKEANMTIRIGAIPSCDVPWSTLDQSVTNDSINWVSAPIDISCATSVTVSMTIEGLYPANMEPSDYLNIYYRVDGDGLGEVPISLNTGGFAKKKISQNVSGNTLRLVIKAQNSFADETYNITKIRVTEGNAGRIDNNSVSYNPEARSLTIYPNPINQDEIVIDFSSYNLNKSPANIELYTMTGTKVFSKQTMLNEKVQLKFGSKIKNSIYCLKVSTKDRVWVEKVLIRR